MSLLSSIFNQLRFGPEDAFIETVVGTRDTGQPEGG